MTIQMQPLLDTLKTMFMPVTSESNMTLIKYEDYSRCGKQIWYNINYNIDYYYMITNTHTRISYNLLYPV